MGLFAALAFATSAWSDGNGNDDGDYLVRAYFDNAGFLVDGEDVRIAGAIVGNIQEVDVSRPGEAVTEDGSEDPGKAVVVMNITDGGFQDFLTDATCLIRPQSLLGEKYVDCQPTQARAPGSEPPPPLEQIADGEIGEGQYRLPLENNGKQVDLDLINNITRQPESERFRLIINDLGAGLAARGEDLSNVIRRADPALRETDEVLAQLADQNRELAQLAVDSDRILAPLAREREHVAGFIRNATIAGEASAERRNDIVLGFQRFPEALEQLQLTMVELQRFADEATPVATDLRIAAPGFTGATEALQPFSKAGTGALLSLGRATEAAGPDLAASDPVIRSLKKLGEANTPGAKALKSTLATFRKTKGIDYLMSFILNTSNVFNGFDDLGHYLRAQLQITNCVEYVEAAIPGSGCDARFVDPSTLSRARADEGDPARRWPARRRGRRLERRWRGRRDRRDPRSRRRRRRRQGGRQRLVLRARLDRPRGERDLRPPQLPGRRRAMRRRRGSPLNAAFRNPTVIGALAVLITILTVFLAYNANNGLPFVESYRLTAQVPNAEALVVGNEVRIGGVRVGVVEGIEPVAHDDGTQTANLDLKLDKSVDPLPVDSELIIRSRSALGLKYVQISRGTSDEGFAEGSVLPLAAATPEPVEIDELFSTFDEETRVAIQGNLTEFGNALAGRGPALNEAIGALQPLLPRLTRVMRILGNEQRGIGQFFRALEQSASEVAPVAEIQAQMFVDLDTTLKAFADVARPYIQDTITKGAETLLVTSETLPRIRPFLVNSTRALQGPAAGRAGSRRLRRHDRERAARRHPGPA